MSCFKRINKVKMTTKFPCQIPCDGNYFMFIFINNNDVCGNISRLPVGMYLCVHLHLLKSRLKL